MSEKARTAIRLGLLGGFDLRGRDGEPLTLGMRKAKALLAWLALHIGRPQARDRVAALFWPEGTDAQARHSLRQALSVLRRSLPDAKLTLVTEGDTVTLASGAVRTDVADFYKLAESADPQDLERAVALYRGDLLEGSGALASGFEDWMLQERSALREQAVRVLARLLDHYRAEGTREPALRAAVRLLSLDPLRESVHRELMELFVLLGRPAEALRQYRSCKALVYRELGVAPEPATVELYRRILSDRNRPTMSIEPDPERAPIPQTLSPVPANGSPRMPALCQGLIGREAELRQITAALDTCVESGAGGTLLMRGEAGIGKTSLSEGVEELSRQRRFRVHRLRLLDTGNEARGPSTAVLIRELLGLSDHCGESAIRAAVNDVCIDPDAALFLLNPLGVPLEMAEERFYRALDIPSRTDGVHRALGRLMRGASRVQPRLLVVEDIHWADADLLLLLAGLAADAAAEPFMLVLTTRTEGEPLDPAWRGAMRGAPLTTLDLGPLRPEAARDLAHRYGTTDATWTRRCLERAGGNPLFLKHLLEAGPEAGDRVPASVQELVELQIAHLPPEERRTVQAAAVLGQSFSADSLAALLDSETDPCRALSVARLVRRDGERLRFSHALVRDGIYQSISRPARRAWHRRAARWYRERDPLLRAEHLDRGGDPGVVSAWLAAARQWLDGHRYEGARDLAERAWRLAQAPGERAESGLFLAVLLREMGDIAGSCRVLGTLIAGCEDEAARCSAHIEMAAALLVQDRYEEALRNLDEAAGTAEALGDDGWLAKLHYQRGNAMFPLGRLDDCMAAHKKALEHARSAGAPELEVRALSGLADAYYQRGRMVTAHHYFDRCVRLCETHDLIRVQAANLAGRAMTALYLNRLADDMADANASVRLAVLTRSQRDECLARNILCIAATEGGDYERVESEAEVGLVLARAVGSRRFEADHLCMRGVARVARGNRAKGLADLDASCELIRDSDMAYGGPWTLGYLAQLTDDPDQRRAALEEGEAVLSDEVVSHNHLQFRQCALQIALQDQDWAALEHHASALEDYTREEPLPWADFQVALSRALMAWGKGERDAGLVRRLAALEAEARQGGLEPAAAAIADARDRGEPV